MMTTKLFYWGTTIASFRVGVGGEGVVTDYTVPSGGGGLTGKPHRYET